MPPWGCYHAFSIAKDSVFATGAKFLTAYPHLTDESLVVYTSPELSRLLIPAGMTARASNETIKALQDSKYLETRLNLEGVRSVVKGVVDAGLLNDPLHDIQALFTQIHLFGRAILTHLHQRLNWRVCKPITDEKSLPVLKEAYSTLIRGIYPPSPAPRRLR